MGTGFFYRHDRLPFLITAAHVVTGRHAETGRPTADNASLPDSLTIHVPSLHPPSSFPQFAHLEEENVQVIQWRAKTAQLYIDADCAEPDWYMHPELGSGVDLVAIPFEDEDLQETAIIAAGSDELALRRFELQVTADVFVAGFPQGLSGGGKLPIWKRGSVATEPGVDYGRLPRFLIDAATRPGMSGSPVYAKSGDVWWPEGSGEVNEMTFGTSFMFCGVYTGRTATTNEFEAQIGYVWKEQAIIEVITGRRRGASSFFP